MPLQITDVRAHPGDSAFLLDDGTTAVLYDTGFAFTGSAVAANIQRILGERPLDWILLTHSHYDHAAGTPYICARYPGVKVAAGAYAKRIFEKPTARCAMWELDRSFAAECGAPEVENRLDELRADLPVTDGDTVQAGTMTFTALELPGHTKCSVGYYLASEKLLLSSETLGVYDGESSVVPSCLVGYRLALDSIAKVEKLGAERILLPHFGVLDREESAFYLSLCRPNLVETAEAMTEILRSGGSHADALAWFREKYYHGMIVSVYPEKAMELNTGIMIRLFEKEILQNGGDSV